MVPSYSGQINVTVYCKKAQYVFIFTQKNSAVNFTYLFPRYCGWHEKIF